MRVYIGASGIGVGHITRCEPIAHKLMELGADVAFSTYLDGEEYARRKNLKLVKTVATYFNFKPDGTIDFKQTAASKPGFFSGLYSLLRQFNREIKNIESYKPNVVFSDSRGSPLIAAAAFNIPSVVMLNQYRVDIIRRPTTVENIALLDRLFYFVANIVWTFARTMLEGVWSLSKYILIPDLPAPYTISLSNLAIPRSHQRKVKLIGPVIDVKPDQLPDQTELKRKLGFDPSKPLIHCSVSGSKFERAYFANKLTHILSRLPDKYQAVLSRGDFEGSSRPERRNNLLVYNWIENQHEYYKACDLVVSRAGHGTILKSLTYGKPLILIPIPEHTEQYGNARRAAQLKLAKVINQNQLSRESFLNAVEEILQSDGYSRRALQVSEMTRSLDAVETAAKIIMSVT